LKDSNPNAILLRHARAILPEQIAESACLLIVEGRIARIFGPDESLPEIDAALNLQGLTLFPGFIDVHIHGAVGIDAMEAHGAQLVRVSQFLATRGVTGWLSTFVPSAAERYVSAVGAIDNCIKEQSEETERVRGARLLGVHYEGPFVNEAQCGALHREHFRTYAVSADVTDLPVPQSPGAVRMITVAPEIGGGIDLVRELKQRGWVISIGHTRATPDILDAAFAGGARHMTHFMNAMAPLHHRAPGPIAWGLSRDGVTCDLIADGIHLDPFMLHLLLKLKTPERIALISDAIAAAGLGDGAYEIWGETIAVRNGRTANVHGSIAGSVITMLEAVRTMLSLGASEIDVARMAAANPARLLGIEWDCGSIEIGKRADLAALDRDGEVMLTLVGGKVAYQSDRSPVTIT